MVKLPPPCTLVIASACGTLAALQSTVDLAFGWLGQAAQPPGVFRAGTRTVLTEDAVRYLFKLMTDWLQARETVEKLTPLSARVFLQVGGAVHVIVSTFLLFLYRGPSAYQYFLEANLRAGTLSLKTLDNKRMSLGGKPASKSDLTASGSSEVRSVSLLTLHGVGIIIGPGSRQVKESSESTQTLETLTTDDPDALLVGGTWVNLNLNRPREGPFLKRRSLSKHHYSLRLIMRAITTLVLPAAINGSSCLWLVALFPSSVEVSRLALRVLLDIHFRIGNRMKTSREAVQQDFIAQTLGFIDEARQHTASLDDADLRAIARASAHHNRSHTLPPESKPRGSMTRLQAHNLLQRCVQALKVRSLTPASPPRKPLTDVLVLPLELPLPFPF